MTWRVNYICFVVGAQRLSGRVLAFGSRVRSEALCCVIEEVNLYRLNPGKGLDMTEKKIIRHICIRVTALYFVPVD